MTPCSDAFMYCHTMKHSSDTLTDWKVDCQQWPFVITDKRKHPHSHPTARGVTCMTMEGKRNQAVASAQIKYKL